MMTGTSFAGGRGCLRKRNEKGLRNGRSEYLATSYEETENGFLSSPKKEEGRHMQALCRQEGLPSQKKWKKAFEIKEGEYLATSCEKTMYRGAEKTVFLLLPLGENGEPITDTKVPLWGYYVQEKAKKMQLSKVDSCLFCRLGREKRTPSRKQGRVVQLFVEDGSSSSAADVPVEAPVGDLVEI